MGLLSAGHEGPRENPILVAPMLIGPETHALEVVVGGRAPACIPGGPAEVWASPGAPGAAAEAQEPPRTPEATAGAQEEETRELLW